MNVGLETSINVGTVEVSTVVQTTKEVAPTRLRILGINITFGFNGQATVTTRWEWLDDDGRVVKSGVDRKTEADLASLGLDVAALKALFAAAAKASAEAK